MGSWPGSPGATLKTRGAAIRLVVTALRARGVDPAALLERAGLANVDLSARELSVPASAVHDLIEFAAEAANDPAFGLHLAEMDDPRDWGMFFYLLGAADTVRQAMSLSVKHLQLAYPTANPVLSLEADGAVAIDFTYVELRRHDLKHSIEFLNAFMLRLFRHIAGPAFKPETLRFEHERHSALDEFEQFFGCPVTFGAPSDRVTFSRATMDLPVASADPEMFNVLEPLAQSAKDTRRAEARSLRAAVENELRRQLPTGKSAIEPVASALGVSARSLSRKFAAEGTTFSAVVDDLRRTLALQYLAEPNLSISQVAYMVGYEEPRTFSNAFRRWTGASPSQARADPALLHRLTQAGDDEPEPPAIRSHR